jgi:GntR family transcriptional regulator
MKLEKLTRLEKKNATPLYLQLAKRLRTFIAQEEITDGEALPSERELCAALGASRVTVRKAIEALIAEGLLVRRQGSGTFVAPRIEAAASFLTGFTEDAARRGQPVAVMWMLQDYGEASAEEARLLELAEDDPVVRLCRVRLSNGEPLAIENAVIPKDFLPPLEELGNSLYAALDAMGNRPVKGTQRIRASWATSEEAHLLSIPERTEVLRIERLTRLADGRPVELTRSAYRGDRYDFVSDLS